MCGEYAHRTLRATRAVASVGRNDDAMRFQHRASEALHLQVRDGLQDLRWFWSNSDYSLPEPRQSNEQHDEINSSIHTE